MIGADIKGDRVEIAVKKGEGGFHLESMPIEGFTRRYGRSPRLLLAVPLRAITVHTYTAQTSELEAAPEELLLLAEAQTRKPLVMALKAGPRQTVYHFLGTEPIPAYPRAKLAPRFLAYWAELGAFANGILVYSEEGEHLAALIQDGHWRTIRTLVEGVETPTSLVGEVERLLRFAQTQGMETPTLYVPESVAMDYAHLAERGVPVEVYLPEGLAAQGLHRLPESAFFRPAVASKPSSLAAPSSAGALLLVAGLALAAFGLGQQLYLTYKRASLQAPYREAVQAEITHRRLNTQIEGLRQALKGWQDYQARWQNAPAQDLLDALVGLSVQDGVGLKRLTLDAATPGVLRGSLEARAKTPPVEYLETLRTQDGRTVFLKVYNRGGVLEVEVQARGR